MAGDAAKAPEQLDRLTVVVDDSACGPRELVELALHLGILATKLRVVEYAPGVLLPDLLKRRLQAPAITGAVIADWGTKQRTNLRSPVARETYEVKHLDKVVLEASRREVARTRAVSGTFNVDREPTVPAMIRLAVVDAAAGGAAEDVV